MLLPKLCMILCLQVLVAQSNAEFSARELDSLLQRYALRAFIRPKTGVVYNGQLPSNLTGIEVAALRLRSGALRRKGFGSYREFHIPVGVVEQPFVKRLVLVYHNIANWSSLYYPLPGYNLLTPVLGLLAYDAADLSATGLSELDVRASGDPISIKFSDVKPWPKGPSPVCVYFGIDGSVGFDRVVNDDTCLTTNQGHFFIAVESSVAAPAPAPAGGGGGKGRWSKKLWIIIGSVVGGILVFVLSAAGVSYVKKCRHRKRIRGMEEAAEWGVVLPMASVGYTKAPVALETRTRPLLENEFVP